MKLVSLTILSAILLSTAVPAFAGQSQYGNALRERALAGQITPNGVWDGR
jgi:hypothetical protein